MSGDYSQDGENQYPFVHKRVGDSVTCQDHEKRIMLTEQAVMSLKQTNEGLTAKMDLLLVQMTKVALLEEKHLTQQQDVARAHTKVDETTKALNTLALETRAFMNYAKGQGTVLWAIGVVVAALTVKALFFAANHGMTP